MLAPKAKEDGLPTSHEKPEIPPAIQVGSRILSTLVLAIGAMGLAGWMFNLPLLGSLAPGLTRMKANGALCFLLLGMALELVPFHSAPDGKRRLFARVAASAALAIGLATLAEYLFQWDLGIDQLLFRDGERVHLNLRPGRMAIGAAAGFVLAGVALLLMCVPRGWRWRARELAVCGACIALIGLFSPMGTAVPDPLLAGWWRATPMAVHTAAGLVLVGGAILLFAWHEARPRWTAERTIALGFVFTIIILVFLSVSGYLNEYDMMLSSQAVQHSQEVLNKAQSVLYDVVDAEAGRRGYLISDEERFLDAYWTGTRKLQTDLDALRELTADDTSQQRRIAELEPLLSQWLAQFKVSLELRRDKPEDVAKQNALTIQGSELMGRIRAAIKDLEQAENRLLVQRHAAVRAAGRKAFYVEPFGDALAYAAIIVGMVILFRDMAQRRRAETELRASEGRFRGLFENMMHGAAHCRMLFDAQRRPVDFIYLDVNSAFGRLTGLANVVGKRASEVIPGIRESNPELLETYARVSLTGAPEHFEFEFKPLAKWLSISVYRPQAEHFVAVFDDITERVKGEAERRAVEAQIQHAQKLESLGVLAGGIAHDFNNLLMVIQGNAELVLPVLPEEAPERERIASIHTASQRAAELCRQMLAYAGKERFVTERLDLNRVIKEMGELLEVSITKNAVLDYRLASKLPPIAADVTQMRQVVMNLITNASEAIVGDSGVITISTGVLDCDRRYLRQAFGIMEDAIAGPYVFLEVSDTGSGIAPEIRDRIFDPFFSTKFTGRGLGLAAALGIVRGHKGAISVYSEPGRGTTFKVLLPATAGETVPEPVAEPPAAVVRGRGTVLVVDDEQDVRSVVKAILDSAGFCVRTANSGLEAVETFRRDADETWCVLLDLVMPNMDAQETLRGLRSIRKAVPVILTSGYSEQEAGERFAGLGLSGFIQKPYRKAELLDVLARATGHAEGSRLKAEG